MCHVGIIRYDLFSFAVPTQPNLPRMFNEKGDTYEPRSDAGTPVNDTWPYWPSCFVSDVVQEDTEDTEVTDSDQGQVHTEEDSHLEEALDESQTFFSQFEGNSNSELEGQSKKSKAAETRKTWSADEQEEIKALFKKFFDLKKRPTPKDCLKAQRKSKRENGFIHERKKDVLKKKVFRMIDKLSD